MGQPVKEILTQGEAALSTSTQKTSMYFLETLGNICYDGKMYTAAIKLADAAIAESTRYRYYGGSSPLRSVYKLLGNSYTSLKRYDEAFKAYQQMANVADSAWKREEAEEAMRRVAKVGNLYEKQIPEQLKKIEKTPDDPDARFALAQSYEFSDKVDEAIAQYQKMSELQPDNPQWYQKLGDLYQKQHQTSEIIEDTALTLDGNSSFVEIVDSDLLNAITQQVTVSAWVKPIDFPNEYTAIIQKGDKRTSNVSNRSYTLFLREDGVIQFSLSPRGRGEHNLFSAPGTISLNTWYHVACVVDAKRDVMRLFINGTEVASGNLSRDSFYQSRLPLRIGWTHEEDTPAHGSFAGQIDEVRIWNIARTEAEIRSDMNTQLTGDEPGLVAYWKFDEETDGIVADASPNKNDGRLIGNAKLTSYTRPVFESSNPEQLAQAAAAYEQAIQLEPNSYELYRLLAQTYTKDEQLSAAEGVYRRALDASLEQSEYDAAVKAILQLYTENGQKDKHIAFLEELRPRMENSAVLHELLGDAYKKLGNTENAELAYTEWLKLRQKEVNQQANSWNYHEFAAQLLIKGLYPETALKFAELAGLNTTSEIYILTLGQAYLVNERYEEALEQFKRGLNTSTSENFERQFFAHLTQVSRKVKNKERYAEMLNNLVDATSNNPSVHLKLNLLLAEFYRENDMPDSANAYMQRTGFITEDVWLILGPFDNTDHIGYDTAYIQEDATQINTAAKYDAVDGQVSWQKSSDDTLNGYINLGENVDWGVAYAFATVTSPDERQVQLRFDSDDQGKIWLNGEEVFAHTRTYSAEIDRDIIPVVLKPGKNSILVKVCEEEQGWGFYLRITDTDGKPFEDLIIGDSERINNR